MRWLFAALLLGFAMPALAEVEITADGALEWRRAERMYVARGGATARQDELLVRADTLVAQYRDVGAGTRIWRLSGDGNLVVTSPGGEASGARGSYDLDQDVVVLTGGDLRFASGTGDLVTARDSLEYWQGRRLAVARGAATATRDGDTLTADVLIATLSDAATEGGRIVRLDAVGNVSLSTGADVLRGDRGVYDVARQTAIVTGDVTIARGQDMLAGDMAEIDLRTGISKLYAGDKGDGRVRGVFRPQGDEDGDATGSR